jgi:hypothetical protein
MEPSLPHGQLSCPYFWERAMFSTSNYRWGTESGRNQRERSSRSGWRGRPVLEELERRELPAPLIAGALAAPEVSSSLLRAASVSQSPVGHNQVSSQFNAVQALIQSGFSTTVYSSPQPLAGVSNALAAASIGGQLSIVPPSQFTPNGFSPLVVASTAFSGLGFRTTPGVPSAIRVGTPIPETPGSFASMPRSPQYITEGVQLTGGGGALSEESEFHTEDPDFSNPQTWIESSSSTPPDASAEPAFDVVSAAIYQLTAV